MRRLLPSSFLSFLSIPGLAGTELGSAVAEASGSCCEKPCGGGRRRCGGHRPRSGARAGQSPARSPCRFLGHAQGCCGGHGPCARPALCLWVVLLSEAAHRVCGVFSVRCCQCKVKRFGAGECGVEVGLCLNGDGESISCSSALDHPVNIPKLVINSV